MPEIQISARKLFLKNGLQHAILASIDALAYEDILPTLIPLPSLRTMHRNFAAHDLLDDGKASRAVM